MTPDKRHNCTYFTTDVLSMMDPTGFHHVEWHDTTLHIHTTSSSPTGGRAPCGTSPDNRLPRPHSADPPDPSALLWQPTAQAAFTCLQSTGPFFASLPTDYPGTHPPVAGRPHCLPSDCLAHRCMDCFPSQWPSDEFSDASDALVITAFLPQHSTLYDL